MAVKMMVNLKLKNPLPDNQLEELKTGFNRILKAQVMKEKIKGKRLEWLFKAKKPELLTEDGVKLVFRKCKLVKELKGVDIAQ